MFKFFALVAFLICSAITLTAPAQAQTQARFSILEDGKEVFDKQTGLKWQRCTMGQDWDGKTCFGSPITKTFDVLQSSLKPKPNAADAKWRLPTEKELASLIDKQFKSPTIDPAAFPNTPLGYFWTSTPYSGNTELIRYVYFTDGFI